MFLRLNNKFKNRHCINTELSNLVDKDYGKFTTKWFNGMNNFHRDKSKTGIFKKKKSIVSNKKIKNSESA